MQYVMYQPDRAVQMILSGIEFIALLSGFVIAGVLLIWSGLALWIGISERRRPRSRQRAESVTTNLISERSKLI